MSWPGTTWKAYERRIAKLLGTKRIPVSGRQEDLGGRDLEDPMFHYSLKLGYEQPKRLRQWLAAATNAAENRVPVVIWKANRQPDKDALVMLRLEDWVDLHGNA